MTLGRLARGAILPAVGFGMFAAASLMVLAPDRSAPHVLACSGAPIGTVQGGVSDCGSGGMMQAPGGTVIGAAPSQDAIIACRGIAGCLSQAVNSPGYVQVPRVSTQIQNSQ